MVKSLTLHYSPDHALATMIDDVLTLRRRELMAAQREARPWPRAGNDELKTFTYTQFREYVYTNFPRLRRGDLKSLPDRRTLMEIADYLECTIAERNRLLLTGGHLPVPHYLAGDELRPLLRIAGDALSRAGLPGYVINRDWDLHLVNAQLLRLLNLTPRTFAGIPPAHRNLMQLIFDPALPVRATLHASPESWGDTARRNLFAFHQANVLCAFEPWYQERLARWQQLAQFPAIWHEVTRDPEVAFDGDHPSFPLYTAVIVTRHGPVRLRPLLTALGEEPYPQIISYQPVDLAGWAIFRRLGLPLRKARAVYGGGDDHPLQEERAG